MGTILDQMGIAIRTGHHCTQPLMDFYNIPGTARASLPFTIQKMKLIFYKCLKEGNKNASLTTNYKFTA